MDRVQFYSDSGDLIGDTNILDLDLTVFKKTDEINSFNRFIMDAVAMGVFVILGYNALDKMGGWTKYFEIEVCPFHNITQRRLSGTKVTLQGIWGNWNYTEIKNENVYNSDSKNLAEIYDTEVEETIVLYLNKALTKAGRRFKITRWNIQ